MTAIEDLRNKGYTPTSPSLITAFRRMPFNERIKYGRFNSSPYKSRQYASIEFFGRPITFYYDMERKGVFEHYIGKRFRRRNPYADMGLRHAFTSLLHGHSLCWTGCTRHHYHARHYPTKKGANVET